MNYDINCFTGHWPFAYLRHTGMAELIRVHTSAGIESGALASLDSIFYNDPSEGDEIMFPEAAAAGYKPVMSVNPRLPMTMHDIERLNPSAVRVYPAVHGYKLCDSCMMELADGLSAIGMPLLVSGRLSAVREAYLTVWHDPDPSDAADFIKANPKLRIALLSYDKSELFYPALSKAITDSGNVYYDVSWLRGVRVEELADKLTADRMLYGSLHPLMCLESTRLTVDKSGLTDVEKAKVFSENYMNFFTFT